ncbi:C40 family peptidase [Bacillus sp. CRN 9]|nr:C40 family peptidase [Bacillus sp. CRN 9]
MEANNKWLVNVPVATLWTSYDSPRGIDQQAIKKIADIEGWLSTLTYETSLDLCNSNLVQSQLLYGEEVIVIEEKEDWVHVLVQSQASSKNKQGYPGWIPSRQLRQREGWSINKSRVAVIRAKKAKILLDNKQELLLSYLTILPVIAEEQASVIVQTPEGTGILNSGDVSICESISEQPKGNGADIVQAAEQFLGLPYLWGGMSSYGYDCSGLSYAACKANGYIIPRDAHDQAAAGEKVELTQLLPGDLLFFAYEEGKGSLHHVGIYYGEGKLLHSPNTGKMIEIIDLKGTVYEKELCAARRYWNEWGNNDVK